MSFSILLLLYFGESHRIILNYIELNFKFNYAASFIITAKMLIFLAVFYNLVLEVLKHCFGPLGFLPYYICMVVPINPIFNYY